MRRSLTSSRLSFAVVATAQSHIAVSGLAPPHFCQLTFYSVRSPSLTHCRSKGQTCFVQRRIEFTVIHYFIMPATSVLRIFSPPPSSSRCSPRSPIFMVAISVFNSRCCSFSWGAHSVQVLQICPWYLQEEALLA